MYAEIPGLCHLIRLDQQFAFDPCLTCTPCVPLAQTARRDQSDSGSGLTTNRANQTTPRDSNFAFDVSCSPQPAARFRPLPPLQVSRPRCRRQRSNRLASTGLSKTAVFDVDENLRSHRAAWACDPCSVSQELPSLGTRAAALSFNRIAVLLNANTAVLASNLSASHACVAYLMVGTGDFHPDPDCGELT